MNPICKLADRLIDFRKRHRFWSYLLGAFVPTPRNGEVRRWIVGRPVTRALLIADVVFYPVWWALLLVTMAALSVLMIPWAGLRELPDAALAIIQGIAGPDDPRSVSRLFGRLATRLDPPPLRLDAVRVEGVERLQLVETREPRT